MYTRCAVEQLRCCRAHFSFLSYFIAHIIKYFGIYNSFVTKYVFCSIQYQKKLICLVPLAFFTLKNCSNCFSHVRHNLYNDFHYNFHN